MLGSFILGSLCHNVLRGTQYYVEHSMLLARLSRCLRLSFFCCMRSSHSEPYDEPDEFGTAASPPCGAESVLRVNRFLRPFIFVTYFDHLQQIFAFLGLGNTKLQLSNRTTSGICKWISRWNMAPVTKTLRLETSLFRHEHATLLDARMRDFYTRRSLCYDAPKFGVRTAYHPSDSLMILCLQKAMHMCCSFIIKFRKTHKFFLKTRQALRRVTIGVQFDFQNEPSCGVLLAIICCRCYRRSCQGKSM